MNAETGTAEMARLAATVVRNAGGCVTFDEYDSLMCKQQYFPPFAWSIGWGLSRTERKANTDKMAAFAAVDAGLLEATETGYCCTGKPLS